MANILFNEYYKIRNEEEKRKREPFEFVSQYKKPQQYISAAPDENKENQVKDVSSQPKVETKKQHTLETPDVSSLELLENEEYAQYRDNGFTTKNKEVDIEERDSRARKNYAERQKETAPDLSSQEYIEDHLPNNKTGFKGLVNNETDTFFRKELSPILQTIYAAKYSSDFEKQIEERYQNDEVYKRWVDKSESILDSYAREHPEIDFMEAFDGIQEIKGNGYLWELLNYKDRYKLTNDEESSKVKENKKEKILDIISNALVAASFIPGADTVTNLLSIPVDIARGDWVSAGLDAVGMIPFVGEIADVAKTARFADKAIGTANAARKAVNIATDIGNAVDTAKTVENVVVAAKIAEMTDKSADTLKATKNVTKITDEAINQVPKVDIRGFVDEQNIFIQNQHKELLKYAKDSNDSKEVAFVFRKGLTDKTVFTGSDDVIDFGDGLIGKGDDLIIMHNHPRNSSYSDRDIRFIISNENVNMLSIIKNNGGVELLSKASGYNYQNAKTYLARAYKKYVESGTEQEISKAINYFLEHNGGNFIWIK